MSVTSVKARVRNNGGFFSIKSIIFAGDSAALHISGVSEIGRCPQGEK